MCACQGTTFCSVFTVFDLYVRFWDQIQAIKLMWNHLPRLCDLIFKVWQLILASCL